MTLKQRLAEVRGEVGGFENKCRVAGIPQYEDLRDMIQASVNEERKFARTCSVTYFVSKPAQVDLLLLSTICRAFELSLTPESIYKELRCCSKFLLPALHLVAEHGERLINNTGWTGPLDVDALHAASTLVDLKEISTWGRASDAV
tara:strand:- start:137 stop:574 length:438 start_codon:yes stop_codon:yes gene_type:complete